MKGISSSAPATSTTNLPVESQGSHPPPKPFIFENGIMKKNPAYYNKSSDTDNAQTTKQSPEEEKALAIIPDTDTYLQLQEDLQTNGEPQVDEHGEPLHQFSKGTQTLMEAMQEPFMTQAVGLNSADKLLTGLGKVFAKYEAPIGLMSKLMMLSEMNKLEFIVDDSGSMTLDSSTKDQNGHHQSRWAEAENRIKEMLEFIAYVPTQKIEIRFLNREDVIELPRNSTDTPEDFLRKSQYKIAQAFAKQPYGGTPIYHKLQQSFKNGKDQSIARYLFCDGTPNSIRNETGKITELLINRENPKQNPMTLLSCTDDEKEVEWMKLAEEAASFCSELSNEKSEGLEVLKDQGTAFPYTKGIHLIAQLIAAMDPNFLDALDESVPFTKPTLDEFLGIKLTTKAYKYYFDAFEKAQEQRSIESPVDAIKKRTQFRESYDAFLTTPLARDIPIVQNFKKEIKQAILNDATAPTTPSKPAYALYP